MRAIWFFASSALLVVLLSALESEAAPRGGRYPKDPIIDDGHHEEPEGTEERARRAVIDGRLDHFNLLKRRMGPQTHKVERRALSNRGKKRGSKGKKRSPKKGVKKSHKKSHKKSPKK